MSNPDPAAVPVGHRRRDDDASPRAGIQRRERLAGADLGSEPPLAVGGADPLHPTMNDVAAERRPIPTFDPIGNDRVHV